MITLRQIAQTKRTLAKEIMELAKPLMWETGWVRGMDSDENVHMVLFKREEGYKVKTENDFRSTCMGFTDEGCAVTDIYLGAVTLPLTDYTIEELYSVRDIAKKHLIESKIYDHAE